MLDQALQEQIAVLRKGIETTCGALLAIGAICRQAAFGNQPLPSLASALPIVRQGQRALQTFGDAIERALPRKPD